MIRLWIGTALLAGSWLLGLGYFYPANPWAWLGSGRRRRRAAGRNRRCQAVAASQLTALDAVTLALLLPAVWFAPWPYRAAPLLIVLGLALQLLPIGQRWCRLAGLRGDGGRRGDARSSTGIGSCMPATPPVPRACLAAARPVGRHRRAAGNRRHGRRVERRDALDAAGASPAERPGNCSSIRPRSCFSSAD